MKPFTFRGLMAPVLTAFNNDTSQSINLEVIPAYSSFLAERRILGILVNGTSGEGMSMTVEERERVTEVWAKACRKNGQTVMIQVGGTNLPDVLRLAAHAETCQVDALLCLPELFNKPKTVTELIDYLKRVSKAAPNTPLLYYHLPMWTNVTINMSEFLNKVAGQIPTFVGIKFTSNNLEEGAACLKANNGSFAIFLGADTLLSAAQALGFDSAIATTFNMLPLHGHRIFDKFNCHDLSSAIEAQKELTNLIEIITKEGTWVPTMKAAMNILSDITVGEVRAPLVPLTDAEKQRMKNELNKLNI